MLDYIKRFLIAGIIAFFVSLLFLGGKQTEADTLEVSISNFRNFDNLLSFLSKNLAAYLF